MANHPNRSRAKSPASNPSSNEILNRRLFAKLTQKEAANLVYASEKTWRNWESFDTSPSHRRMHPAIWELFLLKTGQMEISIKNEES